MAARYKLQASPFLLCKLFQSQIFLHNHILNTTKREYVYSYTLDNDLTPAVEKKFVFHTPGK